MRRNIKKMARSAVLVVIVLFFAVLLNYRQLNSSVYYSVVPENDTQEFQWADEAFKEKYTSDASAVFILTEGKDTYVAGISANNKSGLLLCSADILEDSVALKEQLLLKPYVSSILHVTEDYPVALSHYQYAAADYTLEIISISILSAHVDFDSASVLMEEAMKQYTSLDYSEVTVCSFSTYLQKVRSASRVYYRISR